MRALTLLAALCVCCCLLQAATVAQDAPQVATVHVQSPFYGQPQEGTGACGYLSAGSSVEIYDQQGGWLAIRPPVGSFSWVKADDVTPTKQSDIVLAAASGTKSWIGHQGGDERTASPIALEAGEPLKVIGESTSIATGRPEKWYKIAPPSGEFRFLPVQAIAKPAPPQTAAVQPASYTKHVAPAQVQQVSWVARGSRVSTIGLRPAVSQPAPANPAPVEFPPSPSPAFSHSSDVVPAVAMQPVQQPVAFQPQPQPAPVQPAPVQPVQAPNASMIAPAANLPLDPAAARLDLLEQHVSAMIAQPPATWNTMPLAMELQALATTASTPQVRARAEQLWAKVYQCQQIQSSYSQISAAAQPPAQMVRQASYNYEPSHSYGPQPAVVAPVSYAAAQSVQRVQLTPEVKALAPRNVLARVREAAANLTSTGPAPPPPQVALAYGPPQVVPQVAAPQAVSPQVVRVSASESAPVSVENIALAPPDGNTKLSGTGWLMPLVARSQLPLQTRSGVPPYALTDDEGNVRYLITPAPGMNLSEYLRKPVGVVGPVNQLGHLANPHITAHRVVVLTRHE